MKSNQLIQGAILVGLLALAAPGPATADGLHIHLVPLAGDPPPPSSIHGGGNLQTILEAAAKRWERAFRRGPDWDLTIEYRWADTLSRGAAYGREQLEEQGGTPIRPTRALVELRNGETPSGAFDWFADPTPEDNSHYEHYESVVGEVFNEDFEPIGELNVGRVFSTESGPAAGHADLLTVAMHEIGHALGLDFRYAGHIEQITGLTVLITAPLPFARLVFWWSPANHFLTLDPLPLMSASPTPGSRSLISAADALVVAQLTSFKRPDLGEPPDVPHVQELHCCRLVLGAPPTALPPVPDIAE